MTDVTITRYGNLIEVNPDCESILDDMLTYNHRNMLFGKDARTAKKEMQCIATKVYTVSDGKLYALHGVRARVTAELERRGFTVAYVDTRSLPPLVPSMAGIFNTLPDFVFKSGQQAALAYLIGGDSGQIEAPPAWGKTTIMQVVAAAYPTAKILICAPGVDLVNDIYARFSQVFGPAVGKTKEEKGARPRIVVSTFGSAMRGITRLGGPPDIILVDECHRAAAPQFAALLATQRMYHKIFGFTATPKGRSDGAELAVEALLGPIVYSATYDNMVKEGAVCPINAVMVSTAGHVSDPDTSGMSVRTAKKRKAYWRNQARNSLIAAAVRNVPATYDVGDDPQTLVLVETVEHANYLAELLPDFKVVHGDIDAENKANGNSARRADMLAQFESGELRKVIATGVWGTGVNFVQLDVLVYASGAPSHITTTQWAGRNSRLRPGKKYGLLIDFMDEWDDWTLGRARLRTKSYKSHGWSVNVIKI
jgi:superfamily II DNA or RNA helicase